MYFANVSNSAYNLYIKSRKDIATDLHNTMLIISSVHAIAIDIIDTAAFLNELWEENTSDINGFCQGYTSIVINLIQGIIAWVLADKTTVKELSNEVLADIEQDRKESLNHATITATVLQGFFGAFLTTPPIATLELPTLESLKLQAKELGIKGWNFYHNPETLQGKILEVMA
jgi:hypothetical protein